jgi:hypothetical protein
MRRFVRGLSISVYQFFIPSDFRAQIPDVCYAWGGCGWHKHILKHSKHHRQRDASITAKLDLAPHQSQWPSHVSTCIAHPNRCHVRFYSLAFQVHHPANSVNFHAHLFAQPQIKPRALNTAPTPQNPLQPVSQNTVMWYTE